MILRLCVPQNLNVIIYFMRVKKFGFFQFNGGLNRGQSVIPHLNNIFFKQPWFRINKCHTHVDINSWTSLSQNMIEACIILSQKIRILCQARCCDSPISSIHYRRHHMIVSLLRIWKSYQWVDENKGSTWVTEYNSAGNRRCKSSGLWCHVAEFLAFWRMVVHSSSCSSNPQRLLDPEEKGTTVRRKAQNYSPDNTVSQPTRLEYSVESAARTQNPISIHTSLFLPTNALFIKT